MFEVEVEYEFCRTGIPSSFGKGRKTLVVEYGQNVIDMTIELVEKEKEIPVDITVTAVRIKGTVPFLDQFEGYSSMLKTTVPTAEMKKK